MDVSFDKDPVPHMLISDFFAPNEYDVVWHELMWLKPKLKERERYLADEADKAVKFTEYGLAIEELLQHNRRFSDTVLCYNKIFSDLLAEQLVKFDPIYNYTRNVTNNITAVRLFNNFDTWTKHKDAALFTCICHMDKLLSPARGGALVFSESGKEIVLKDNQLIMFPSYVDYEFTTVEYDNDDDFSFLLTRLMW